MIRGVLSASINFLTGEVNLSGNNPKPLLIKNFLEDDNAVADAMRKGKEAHDQRMKEADNG